MFKRLIQIIRLPFIKNRNFYYQLRKITGYFPGKIYLYELAFIHKSASSTQFNGSILNNERLEFLGDAILDSVIADFLYIQFPQKDEGFLTQLRSKIVKRKQLNKLASYLGISSLIISKTRQSPTQKNIFGNALEALIGAVYLDKGYNKTRKFIINRILKKYINLEKLVRKESDFKSRLIEWAQKHKQEISFVNQEEVNPDNKEPLFISQVVIKDKELGTGSGTSKKEAEQKAAEEALATISQEIFLT